MLAENEQGLLAHDGAARRRLRGGVFCAPAKAACAPRDAGGSSSRAVDPPEWR